MATVLVNKAVSFATQAHKRIDQRRKYSQQPYDVHLQAVADLVATVTDDQEMIAAAWLHDVVEDTGVTLEDIEREFGLQVASLVKELTDVSRPGDGNRAARKALDRAHLSEASARAKTIKLADLCDNAVDICQSDPRFGRVYLDEMAALLEILGEGDAGLMEKARNIHAVFTRRLGVPDAVSGSAHRPAGEAKGMEVLAVSRLMNTFRVSDLARPLYSVDETQSDEIAEKTVRTHDCDLIGYRREGVVVKYARVRISSGFARVEARRLIEAGQIVESDASLSVLVHVLTRHDFVFVRAFGQVCGVLARADLERPIGRMWLFGMLTLMEMDFAQRVRTKFPGESWKAYLSPGRLEKAVQLLNERNRRGHAVELVDCLQLSDKASILIQDPELLSEWGFRSKRAAKNAIQDLESFRNNIAHAQDVVTDHWHQIARMTQRFDEALLEFGAG